MGQPGVMQVMQTAMNKLHDHVTAHAASYGVMAFLVVLGLSAGAGTAAGLSGPALDRAAETLSLQYLTRPRGMAAYWPLAFTALRFALLTGACGLWLWGAVPAALLAALRAFLTGFTLALTAGLSGGGRLPLTVFVLLPSALIATLGQMAMSSMAVWAATFPLRAGIRMPLRERIMYLKPFWQTVALALALTLAASAWDALLM